MRLSRSSKYGTVEVRKTSGLVGLVGRDDSDHARHRTHEFSLRERGLGTPTLIPPSRTHFKLWSDPLPYNSKHRMSHARENRRFDGFGHFAGPLHFA